MATISDPTLERSPFQGLGFYTEADARWFFGRLTERRIILAHLRTARLTLLYAESGVGKSSLLRAGVSARLRELAARGEPGRSPRHIPVVFSAWKDDPVQDLIAAIQGLAPDRDGSSLNADAASATDGGLADAITATASALDATLVIMLDQFEEHFSYRHAGGRPDRLADELAQCVNSPDVPANFLIAVREDAYGRLGDLFSGRIGNVYDNYLHLEYMSREAAREAIEGPVAMYNAEHGDDEAITIEDDLTEAVLEEVRRGNLELGGRRADRDDGGARWSSGHGDEIETPFLQLVMTRLWECERAQGSRVLRRATLDDELGGAEAIVRNHVSRALAGLDEPQLEAATDIFGDLVTPSGAKVAHTAADLAQMSGRQTGTVTSILDRLYEERIVRAVDPAPGTSEARYEIFHDRLSAPILDWRDGQESARLRRERHDAEVEAATQRRQARRFKRRARITLVLAISLLAVLVGLVIALRYAHRQSAAATQAKQAALKDTAEATSFALTARAQSQLLGRPAVSLLLYLAAYRASPQPVAERNLVATLNATRLSYAAGILHGDTDAVEGIAFSPDSRTLASVSADKTIRLWRVTATGHYPLGSPLRADDPLYSVAFSPNGQTLAAGSFDHVVLWSIPRHAEEGVIPYRAATVASVAYGPGGVLLAAGGSNGTVLLLNTATHQRRLLHVASSGPIRGIAFSPNGTVLAVATVDAVTLWNTSTAQPVGMPLTAEISVVNSVAFSPNGHTLAAGAENGAIALWNPDTHRELAVLREKRTVDSIAFTPDGHTLAAAGEGTTVLWSISGHRRIAALTGHQGAIYSVAVSPDGRFLASGGADRTITLWHSPIGRVLGVPILRRRAGFSAVAVSRNGQIAAGALDGAIVLSQQDGTHREVLPEPDLTAGPVTDVAFDPTGRLVAGAYGDGSLRVWDIATRRPLSVAFAPIGPILSIAFNHSGSLLVSGAHSGAVQLWTMPGLRPLGHAMHGGPGRVYAVTFSPDGRVIAAGGNDRAIRLWDARTQKPLDPPVIPQVDAVFGLAFSPDGHLLASGDGGDAIHIWRLRNHGFALDQTLTGDSNFVRSVAFSPDGRTLASGSTDTTIRLWDVADGAELGSPFMADTGSVESVAFRADGRLLASASVDGTVRLWPVVGQPASFAVLSSEVCSFVGAGLSRAEWSEYAAGIPYRQTCPRSTPS
jgi:WD40 repeat protein